MSFSCGASLVGLRGAATDDLRRAGGILGRQPPYCHHAEHCSHAERRSHEEHRSHVAHLSHAEHRSHVGLRVCRFWSQATLP